MIELVTLCDHNLEFVAEATGRDIDDLRTALQTAHAQNNILVIAVPQWRRA